jgi:hypothetical protein
VSDSHRRAKRSTDKGSDEHRAGAFSNGQPHQRSQRNSSADGRRILNEVSWQIAVRIRLVNVRRVRMDVFADV